MLKKEVLILMISLIYSFNVFAHGEQLWENLVAGQVSGYFNSCTPYGPNALRAIAKHNSLQRTFSNMCAYEGGLSRSEKPSITVKLVRSGKNKDHCTINAKSIFVCE
jgi:hypothetical protein